MRNKRESSNAGGGTCAGVQTGSSTTSAPGTSCVAREQMIAEAAYYRAEQRGFSPGLELADWLEAEAEVERRSRDAQSPMKHP